jgi:hypothetical protein
MSSGPEKVDCGASQEVDRSKFSPEVQKCLELWDRFERGEINAQELDEGLRNLKRKQPRLILKA